MTTRRKHMEDEVREIQIEDLGAPAVWIGRHRLLLLDAGLTSDEMASLREQARARGRQSRAQ